MPLPRSIRWRGRALDNIFCERLLRNVQYESIYLKQYDSVRRLQVGLTEHFASYKNEGPHKRLKLSHTI